MALHHQPELSNIRAAYDGQPSSDGGDGSSQPNAQRLPSESGYQTEQTVLTGSTEHSHAGLKQRPLLQVNTQTTAAEPSGQFFANQLTQESPRSSVLSQVSTVQSEEAVGEDLPLYNVPHHTRQVDEPSPIPATPSDFSELFPSHRTLIIRHDDSTLDGNMNLRIDTEVTMHGGARRNMTLFHLRLHDLKTRDFSLRRYCRDSGREVCHSLRKERTMAAERRPSLSRAISRTLHTIRPKLEPRTSTSPSPHTRNDSGYGSLHSTDLQSSKRPGSSDGPVVQRTSQSSNIIRLEFSNYAQVDVKRTGVKGSKRYEFEYWGIRYAWRRSVAGGGEEPQGVSYHLTAAGTDQTLASILPESAQERRRGGWVPPCSMRIDDKGIVHAPKDVSDVIVASGVIALVDESIRRHFRPEQNSGFLIPVPKLQLSMEFIDPKRVLTEIFGHDSSAAQSNASSDSQQSSSGQRARVAQTAVGPIRRVTD